MRDHGIADWQIMQGTSSRPYLDTAPTFAAWADLLPETGPMPPRRVLMADKTLPHQIKLNYSMVRGTFHALVVQCNCGRLRRIIPTGDTAARDALDRYHAHLVKEGVTDD